MENNNLNQIYTLGIWTVMPGKEKEFISVWTAFANWTSQNMAGSAQGFLLQDEKNSFRFISFGPWKNENSVEKWRDSNEFKKFVEKAKELCEDWQPNTLKLVSASNAGLLQKEPLKPHIEHSSIL